MGKYWQHFKYTSIHKYWVFKYCLEWGIPWQGITHDLSKFRLFKEFIPYARHFFGVYPSYFYDGNWNKVVITQEQIKREFDYAWLAHQNCNKHHWLYYLTVSYKGRLYAEDMPDKYIKEMVCDWRAAGKAKGTSDESIRSAAEYYVENMSRMQLSPKTQIKLEYMLGVKS